MKYTFCVKAEEIMAVTKLASELGFKIKLYNDSNPKHERFDKYCRIVSIYGSGSARFVQFGIDATKQKIRLQ